MEKRKAIGTRLAFFTAMLAILIAVASAYPKLHSTRAQENKMVATAIRISDRWLPKIPLSFNNDPINQKAIEEFRRKLESYGSGIARDMNISGDMAHFFIYGHSQPLVFASLEEFDSAGSLSIDNQDQERYFDAKRQIHQTLIEESAKRADSLKFWMKRICNDEEKLVRFRRSFNQAIDLLTGDIAGTNLPKIVLMPIQLETA